METELKELTKEVKLLRKEVPNNKMKYTETYFKIKLWLFALQMIISIPLISFIIKYLQILSNK